MQASMHASIVTPRRPLTSSRSLVASAATSKYPTDVKYSTYTSENIASPKRGKCHFLHLDDFSTAELTSMLDQAAKMKKAFKSGDTSYQPFRGKTLSMIFAKSSMRTLVSFNTGFSKLGGQAQFLGPNEVGVGTREAPKDVARVLSGYNDMIMARLYDHEHLLELADYSDIPVINGLTDYNHPCQIMADALTIIEQRGTLDGAKISYIGDGNNIVHSWLRLATRFNIKFFCICPPGYTPDAKTVELVKNSGVGQVTITSDLNEAQGSDVVYTDVWASMGQKHEFEERFKKFQGYRVDSKVMELAGPQAVFMHCLPAERGIEVTDEVMESKQSIVFQEAENRMWAQMAVMTHALGCENI